MAQANFQFMSLKMRESLSCNFIPRSKRKVKKEYVSHFYGILNNDAV